MSTAAPTQIFGLRIVIRPTETVPVSELPAAVVYALVARAYGEASQSKAGLPDGLLSDAPERARRLNMHHAWMRCIGPVSVRNSQPCGVW
jgi:hypothetical protein